MSVPADQVFGSAEDAMDDGISEANGENEIDESEQKAVAKTNEEYNAARKFDEGARRKYNKDRKYASGKADKRWASNANLIGSYIAILESFVYAQDPDVSARAAEKAGSSPDPDQAAFSETLQIVVSKLWKRAHLKKRMKKTVRSTFAVGPGWLKALMYSEKRQNPQLEKELKDTRDNVARIEQLHKELAEDDAGRQDEKLEELRNQMIGLEGRVEKLVYRGLCIDFVRAEDMQVSLDVADISEYLDADWVSNDMYLRKDVLRTRFPRLTAADEKAAVTYYQVQTQPQNPEIHDGITVPGADAGSADGAYTKADSSGQAKSGVLAEGGNPVEFVKVVEMWRRDENVIKTFVDGVKRWAVEPYAPPYASMRFYPYFLLAFFECDGERHPQSLTEQLDKLQDEYASRRSNGRLARERSIPKTIFNKGMVSENDAKAIVNGANMEMIGIQPTDPLADVAKMVGIIAAPGIDGAVYDTVDIRRDMDVVAGVSEATQQVQTSGVTATAIEAGTAGLTSRTGAYRDAEEEMLNELAQYTAETAMQCLTLEDVQRMAGPLAFWPEGMDVEDILELQTVEVVAGTTGKPQMRADKETWATLLPIVQNFIAIVTQMESTGNPVMVAQAKGYRNLLRETLRRLDDRLSIDSILPPVTVPAAPPVSPTPGATPPGPNGTEGAADPTLPPIGNGTVNNPQTIPPPAAA